MGPGGDNNGAWNRRLSGKTAHRDIHHQGKVDNVLGDNLASNLHFHNQIRAQEEEQGMKFRHVGYYKNVDGSTTFKLRIDGQ